MEDTRQGAGNGHGGQGQAAAVTVVSGAIVGLKALLPQEPDRSIRIDKPAATGVVPRCLSIAGSGKPAQGHQLWIAVRIEGSYYLVAQARQNSAEGRGQWSADAVTVGPEEGVSRTYLLAVLEVAQATDTALRQLSVDGQRDSLWRLALPALPDGMKVVAERQVERDASHRDSCPS
ncbi:hypothetical protein ACIGEZ_19550 [Streptomyces sp. NPDC085481]|uniref:hypothetical protein n=1 Tax=Streptomyces sp. NPDC085481 TaxID=3365727 RepID=UPI0037D5C63F